MSAAARALLALELVVAVFLLWAVMEGQQPALVIPGLVGLFGLVISAGGILAGVDR